MRFFLIFFFIAVSSFSQNVFAQSNKSGKVYKWKLAESWPDNFPIFGDAVHSLIENVDFMTNGQLQIEVHSKEVHKKPLGIFDLVKDGEYEMGHSVSFYWRDKDVNTTFFTTVPFGMIATEQYGWFYHGGGLELMQKAYKPYGLMSFPGGNTGMQMGGWFTKEIKSLEDLKGLKMRIPGLAGNIAKRLGIDVTLLPAGELYAALNTGKIQALEWVGPSLDIGMGFHKVANYYYTGWHEPGAELQFMVNEKAYNELPDDVKRGLNAAMKLAAYDMYIQSQHESAENLQTLLNEFPDTIVRSFPRDVFRAFLRETKNELEKVVSEGGPLTSEIYNSILAYKQKARLWTRFSDQAYLNNSGGLVTD